MAAFRFKLTGLPTGPRGRIYTVADPVANRVLTYCKARGPKVPTGPADPTTGIVPVRNMTDDEAVIYLFDGVMAGILNNSDSHTRESVAKIARDAVVKDTAAPADDNV